VTRRYLRAAANIERRRNTRVLFLPRADALVTGPTSPGLVSAKVPDDALEPSGVTIVSLFRSTTLLTLRLPDADVVPS